MNQLTFDSGYQCADEMCSKQAIWQVKDWHVCTFHKGILMAFDYHNEYKPKKIPHSRGVQS